MSNPWHGLRGRSASWGGQAFGSGNGVPSTPERIFKDMTARRARASRGGFSWLRPTAGQTASSDWAPRRGGGRRCVCWRSWPPGWPSMGWDRRQPGSRRGTRPGPRSFTSRSSPRSPETRPAAAARTCLGRIRRASRGSSSRTGAWPRHCANWASRGAMRPEASLGPGWRRRSSGCVNAFR
jgi:hypothetical protein